MSAADTSIRRHRITVDEYYRMAEVGLLAPDARVELIEGEIIDMAPIGSRHAAIVGLLARALDRLLGDRAQVDSQRPIRLSQRSEPQPDVVVLKPRDDRYSKAHPGPQEVLLLVEVSDSTLRYDSDIKVPLYAAYEIPEVWIIDVNAKELHVLRKPRAGAYQEVSSVRGGFVELAAMPDVHVPLDDLLAL